MRIWFKIWKDNHLQRDYEFEDESDDTRTHKIFRGLEEACHELNLAVPLWLDPTVRAFQKNARARFLPDAFVEEIEFDYLEIHVLEEDVRF